MSLYRGSRSTSRRVETTSFDDRIVDPINMDAYGSYAASAALHANVSLFAIRGVRYFTVYSLSGKH